MIIETPRLILRLWREADLEPFAAMSADPEVMVWLGGVLNDEGVRAYKRRADDAFATLGMCRMVIERRADGAFLGCCGLMPGHEQAPISPYIDIGWRLARSAWGGGYASEAAAAVLKDGFDRLGFPEIIAITAQTNRRSRAVMERIGMRHDAASDFDFPGHEEADPLRATVVYRAARS
ncbi:MULTISPECIES: GNAT family N-acetyltransferase [Phenylobacterium]|uniref:RimJ/RimL family protein N-acetyltransferase n=1 Tax=Phenylobacterium koreense TaxID=266125 RepID=A0ABV2EH37_9CAUL